MSCYELDIDRTVVVNGISVKLDHSLDCGTEFVIYLYLCRHCDNPCARERANGHHACFTESLPYPTTYGISIVSIFIIN